MKLFFQFLRSLLGGGIIEVAVNGLLVAQKQRADAANDKERLAADNRIAVWDRVLKDAESANASLTDRHKLKMNYWVFWFIMGVALLPGLGTFMLLAIYNVLWHADGIWPQTWTIAAFPSPYDQWAQLSIEWVFDPVQMAMTTAVAAGGGFLTGKRS